VRHIPDPTESEARGVIVQGREVVASGDMAFSFVASGGPGGQNVNKRATKCQLRVALGAVRVTDLQRLRLSELAGASLTDSGDILISNDEHRSQERNRAECVERLATLIRRAMVPPKVRRKTRPSRASKERRIEAKKHRGEVKRGRGRHE
jgi:ribosome-associated protein